ncbi:MAG: DUF4347 domain-containing protein, partial [Gammaproteobacteria bacterium]|nr:DUF4347 domain-containing protein [Gammaproteobacteria bacterium]
MFTDTQTQVPCFEQLEPRILLSADASFVSDIQPLETAEVQVICVDLEPGLETGETQCGRGTVEQLDGIQEDKADDSGAVEQIDSQAVVPSDSHRVTQSNSLSVSPIEAVATLSVTQQNEIQSSPTDASEAVEPATNKQHPAPNASINHRGPPTEIVFVESSLNHDFQLKNAYLDDVAVSVLPDDSHGIQFISNTLSQYNNLSAIHIVSHGAPGQVLLGTERLNASTLENQSDLITAWGESLVPTGDILLYGCSIGEGQVGSELVRQLAAITGADIGASANPTGDKGLGGDWNLERLTGPIEARLPFAVETFEGLLAAAPSLTTHTGAADVTFAGSGS